LLTTDQALHLRQKLREARDLLDSWELYNLWDQADDLVIYLTGDLYAQSRCTPCVSHPNPEAWAEAVSTRLEPYLADD
jgi:hypothetical protein